MCTHSNQINTNQLNKVNSTEIIDATTGKIEKKKSQLNLNMKNKNRQKTKSEGNERVLLRLRKYL